MSKTILVLSASARKGGNTDILCDEFMCGAKESGHHTEKINISKLNIKGCLGCRVCQDNGGKCVQRDDMAVIYEKLLAADIFVLASPVYFYSFNSQMKAIMDRTFAIEHVIKDKIVYLIAAGAAPSPEYMTTMIDGFRKYIGCFNHIQDGGIVFGYGVSEKGSVRNTPAIQEAYETGRNIIP